MNKSLQYVVHANMQGIYLIVPLPVTCDLTAFAEKLTMKKCKNKQNTCHLWSFSYPKTVNLFTENPGKARPQSASPPAAE